jgi:hypothetical protein
MYNRKIIWLLFVFGIIQNSFGQVNIDDFKKYTVKNGLSNDHITSLLQDSLGFVWIGTLDGLNRFDGYEFDIIHLPSKSPASNYIFSLTPLSDQEIGVATSQGAFIISIRSGNIKSLDYDMEIELKYWGYIVKGISKDIYGNYGVSTGTGFYVFENNGKLKNKFQAYTKSDINGEWLTYGRNILLMPNGFMMQEHKNGFSVYDPIQDSIILHQNNYPFLDNLLLPLNVNLGFINSDIMYYFQYAHDLNIFNLKTRQKFKYTFKDKSLNYFDWYSSITNIKDSILVINGVLGLYYLKADLKSFKFQFEINSNYTPINIKTCTKLNNENIIFGTENGLYLPILSKRKIQANPISWKSEYPNKQVMHVLPDSNFLFASTRNDGLLILDKKTKKLVTQVNFKKLGGTYNELLYTYNYHKDTLWIITLNGMLWMDKKTKNYGKLDFMDNKGCLQDLIINDIFKDSKGDFWFSGNKANYVVHKTKNRSELIVKDKKNPLLKIASSIYFSEDNQSNIWFSTDAIARWNRKKDKVDSLISYVNGQNSYLHGYRVYFDRNGNQYYVIHGEGILKKNVNGTNTFFYDNFFVPSSDNRIIYLEDKLIYYNRKGQIIIFYFKNDDYRIISEKDGLKDIDTNTFLSFDKSENKLYCTTGNIIYEVPINYKTLENKYLITLKKICINHKNTFINPSNSLELDFKNNTLSLDIGCVNFVDPENMQYSYRLLPNNDSNWIALNVPHIEFNDLASKTYNLELKVNALNNEWSPIIQKINIKINPPFYKTWWFLLPCFGMFLTSIYLYYQHRIKIIHKKSVLDQALSEYEMKALHAQMNPHFVFNCLNSIKEMILKKNNENASKYLNKFAGLMRETINQSQKNWTSVKENMEYLDTYIQMESIRFEKFEYAIEIAENIDQYDTKMASLLLQPLVENAIWHGLRNIKGEKKLTIKLEQKSKFIICTINDNGIGFDNQKKAKLHSKSVGLSNVRKRIDIINQKFGLEYQLHIIDKSLTNNLEKGTLVTLTFLPYYNY